MTTDDQPTITKKFPIVAIGASAGGLEALEQFFDEMPPDSGMGFVIIQHLDPTRKSMLTGLIERHTQMPVVEASQALAVEPNHVYVIPPDREMTINQGRLQLAKQKRTPILKLPIDAFFRSLAEDQAENAIAIILSGSGSDGALGLKDVKEAGGLVMVQEPASARFTAMPQSAIATGLVDYVLAPGEMPEKLITYINISGQVGQAAVEALVSPSADTLQKILILLRTRTGHDFSQYKRSTVMRRIERRMAIRQITGPEDYVIHLQKNPNELEALFRELLIGVTNFFRDEEAFAALESQVIPQFFIDRPLDRPVRVWTPGCASGEEAYSLAILLQEQMDALKKEFKVQIFATDIDDRAIEKARLGLYPRSISANVSAERLRRFFVESEDMVQISEPVRKMVVCAVQSVIKDPPFSRLDLISCRNLLIYLEPELQRKVMALFYYALRPGGYLFLGTSETPVELSPFFTTVDRKWKIFQRTEAAPGCWTTVDLPQGVSWAVPDAAAQPTGENRQTEVRLALERLLLEHYLPPCLIVNEPGDILFTYGQVGKYLQPVGGETGSWNILRMLRESLRMPVGSVIRQAFEQRKETITYKNVQFRANGESRQVDLAANFLERPIALQGLVLVRFIHIDLAPAKGDEPAEAAADGEPGGRVAELERELQATKEYLQATIEELQSSNEEIKSTNEELQSANEELETSQEEAQSINEELATLNSELESKVDDLTWANNDMHNLLASIDVGIIFLDRRLHVRRFNRAVTQVINLIETDLGRPIDHVASNLTDDSWLEAARTVFETLVPREKEVTTRDGGWFLLKLRPYRTENNAIEGVVLTFTNITPQKGTEQVLQDARRLAENIVDTVRQPLLVLDNQLKVISSNRAFHQLFQVSLEETEGQYLYDLGGGQWDIPELRALLEETIADKTRVEDYEVRREFPHLGRRTMRLTARRLVQSGQKAELILLAIEDVT